MTITTQSAPPSALVGDKKAKWGITPFVFLYGIGMIALSLHGLKDAVKAGSIIAAAAYLVLAVLYFWASRAWKDGYTLKEFGYNIVWFVGLAKLVKSVRTEGLRHAKGMYIAADTDTSPRLIKSAKVSVLVGVIVTLIVLAVVPILVFVQLIHLVIALLWLFAAFWGICGVVYYVSGKLWIDGLTGGELFATIFGGPIALGYKVRKASKAKRQLEAMDTPQPIAA